MADLVNGEQTPPVLSIAVVAHTHWDREWYYQAPRFRQRLVALVDALLDGTAGGPFLLDGQAIVLQDYLTARPDRRPALLHALKSGQIDAGPWLVLADNLIPSGEALLRNLEAGRRVVRRFGAATPPVAYCPDTFGHPAAMPMIAHGFGLTVSIVWRGVGADHDSTQDLVWWEAPDGSRVLQHRLTADGYEFGSALPVDAGLAAERWHRIARTLRRRNRSGVVLLLSGADHHARQPDLNEAIAVGQAVISKSESRGTITERVQIEPMSLGDAAARLVVAAGHLDRDGAVLPVTRGEQRNTGEAWALQGTFATRAHQKRTNARLERALRWDAEPWVAHAFLQRQDADTRRGQPAAERYDGRITIAQLPSLLAHAWEHLLSTHPHDTLCGCSIDAVASAMQVVQRAVASEADGIREAAIHAAFDAQADVPHGDVPQPSHAPIIVVRNRVARARGGLVELTVRHKVADVRVGPGSAQPFDSVNAPVDATVRGALPRRASPSLPLPAGMPSQRDHRKLARQRFTHDRLESPQHYPDDDLVVVERVLAWTSPVAACGLLRVRGAERDIGRNHDDAAAGPPHPVVVQTTDDIAAMHNGLVECSVSGDGVTLRVGGRTCSSVLTLESIADVGDTYTTSLRGPAETLTLQRYRVTSRGPLRASVTIDWRSARAEDGGVDGIIEVRTTLIVDAGSPLLRADVRVRNRRTDHRLQLIWQSDVDDKHESGHRAVHVHTEAPVVRADAAFGHVVREPLRVIAHDSDAAFESVGVDDAASSTSPALQTSTHVSQPIEVPPRTMPLHRWASRTAGARGAAILSDGLAECEIDGSRLAVTLLRAVGELSRNDLPERPGHAGWPASVPRAQCMGTYRARVALLLHGAWSAATLDLIENSCDDFLLPLIGESTREPAAANATLTDDQLAGPELVGEGLRASAITVSQDGRALILRARNVSGEARSGHWRLPGAGRWRVTSCRLDETPVGPPWRAQPSAVNARDANPPSVNADSHNRASSPPTRVHCEIPFTIGPCGVQTLRLEPVVD